MNFVTKHTEDRFYLIFIILFQTEFLKNLFLIYFNFKNQIYLILQSFHFKYCTCLWYTPPISHTLLKLITKIQWGIKGNTFRILVILPQNFSSMCKSNRFFLILFKNYPKQCIYFLNCYIIFWNIEWFILLLVILIL